MEKNGTAHYSSEPHDGKRLFISDEGKIWKKGFFSRSSEKHYFLISGHRLRWLWQIEGETCRKPDKLVKMRNWLKRIYTFEGAKIVLNVRTFELWLKARPNKSTARLIYGSWNKADLLARRFAEWAQIGLKPLKSDHLADCQAAHLVIENKPINSVLAPALREGIIPFKPEGIGLITDFSHKGKAEATGPLSIEGMQGAEFVFLQLPSEWRELKAALSLLEGENRATAAALAQVVKILAEKR